MMEGSSDIIPRVVAEQGSEDFERVLNIMAAMLTGAAVDQKLDDLDPAKQTMMTIAAAGVTAGYLAGASIIAGTAQDKDKRRIGEILLTNFRQGVKIGKDQALLSVTEGERPQ
jgi:hypothetical protein